MSFLKEILLMGFCVLIVTGCSTIKDQTYVNYDQSNVVKIEESIQGLDVNSFVSEDLEKDDIIALAPTELDARFEENPRDLGVRYIIEDNLISQLVQNYKVAERDQSLMYYLERETGEKYNKYTESFEGKDSEVKEKAKAPEATTITNNYYGDVSGTASISEAKTEDKESKFTVTTDFIAADKILTYRVLECGVFFRENSLNSGTNVADFDKVNRHARTRLHCRLEDAKTGIILNAGIIENEVVDAVKRSDLENLDAIDYIFYHHTLPTMKNEKEKINEQVSNKKPGPLLNNPSKSIVGRMVGALLVLFLIR